MAGSFFSSRILGFWILWLGQSARNSGSSCGRVRLCAGWRPAPRGDETYDELGQIFVSGRFKLLPGLVSGLDEGIQEGKQGRRATGQERAKGVSRRREEVARLVRGAKQLQLARGA